MHKKLCVAAALLLLFIMQACGQTTNKAYALMLKGLYKNSIPLISPKQLSDKLLQKQAPVLLDARSIAEYKVSHIAKAKFVDYETFDADALKDIPKDAPIVVYCSVGYRSEQIGEKLKTAGYRHVKNLYGGLFEWVNEGHPVFNNQGKTNKVHAYSESWGIWLQKGEKVYGE
jgi:rhodanese-related sulfurtransferase